MLIFYNNTLNLYEIFDIIQEILEFHLKMIQKNNQSLIESQCNETFDMYLTHNSSSRAINRKPEVRKNQLIRKQASQPELQIKYFSPIPNSSQLPDYIKSFNFIMPKPQSTPKNLSLKCVSNISIQPDVHPNNHIQDILAIQYKQPTARDNELNLKLRKNNGNLVQQINQLRLQNKMLRSNMQRLKFQYLKLEKNNERLMEKVKYYDQDVKEVSRKNYDYEQQVRKYASKINHLQVQLRKKNQYLSKNKFKVNRSVIEQIRLRNTQLEEKNRELSTNLQKSNEQIKLLEKQLNMLKRKYENTISKTHRNNEKNKSLIAKQQNSNDNSMIQVKKFSQIQQQSQLILSSRNSLSDLKKLMNSKFR